jgi:hypothetical protein
MADYKVTGSFFFLPLAMAQIKYLPLHHAS